MKYIAIVFFLIMAPPLVAGEALGVKYDDILVLRLKQPEIMKKKSSRLIPSEDFSRYVLSAHPLKKRFHERVDKLFSKDANFDNGSSDSRVQLFALAFYEGDKCVLTVSPNLTGGDIYASDKKGYDPRTFSERQKDEFLQIVYLSMMFGDAPIELKTAKDNKSPSS
jgi:hypothetical protein